MYIRNNKKCLRRTRAAPTERTRYLRHAVAVTHEVADTDLARTEGRHILADYTRGEVRRRAEARAERQ